MKKHNLNHNGHTLEGFSEDFKKFLLKDVSVWKTYATSQDDKNGTGKSLHYTHNLYMVCDSLYDDADFAVYVGEDLEMACKTYLEL